MNRSELHQRFTDRFHFGDRPRPVTESELNAIEDALSSALPTSYREFMCSHGAVHAPGILRSIVKRKLCHPDLQNILSPAEAIEGTQAYWSGGMPSDIVGIASDCMGNMFGFKREPCSDVRPDDLPVWFFDHDFVEAYTLASGFDEFLNWYLEHIEGVD